mmetsp:Transcript_33685/g.55389  ORF Transcript_33685/g.55389 Transcript_33685/m.55389 type:complete len:106 (+) Transcript_33685:158-475(+)|eukprot:CAMPEP_0174366472 /NCGR_PEP_ID=MMETSP0811_2-20130205/81356_1 /TAXON_ID=73025 ORGANISM="Eutreptiella gymnastica-like, Strain CCMP1594" /NCGR_SAMPLE_ID=MMETSP0811_2 /ASSEMBLY_ACC=CAM_ASM_000667 /LENGTH=105 /DNA_ID=CAMNT_0015508075 /DNA_START=158 /DNA_END=475 /DNA_ORIENTATION=-
MGGAGLRALWAFGGIIGKLRLWHELMQPHIYMGSTAPGPRQLKGPQSDASRQQRGGRSQLRERAERPGGPVPKGCVTVVQLLALRVKGIYGTERHLQAPQLGYPT